MTGTRIKESKNGELSLFRSKGIKDGIEDYALSDKLRNLCESICKFQGTADYGNIRIRSVVQWPGRSIDLLVNNKVVFESGYFLLSGSLVYSRLNKKVVTKQLIRKLTSIQNKISGSNDNLTS
jgi:hypothetical protein